MPCGGWRHLAGVGRGRIEDLEAEGIVGSLARRLILLVEQHHQLSKLLHVPGRGCCGKSLFVGHPCAGLRRNTAYMSLTPSPRGVLL